MPSSANLQLGDFVFQRFEIPDEIPLGGPAQINRHLLPGGQIVIDHMGGDYAPITWRAWLKSPDADQRALTLQAMKDAGDQLELSWGNFRYLVVISAFDYRYQKFHQLPYTITLEVIRDLVLGETADTEPGVDDMMVADLDEAGVLIDGIGDATLSSLGADLFALTDEVQSFSQASRDVLSALQNPLTALKSRVTAMVGSAEASLTSVIGGVVAGVPGAVSAQSLIAQVTAAESVGDLQDLGSILGRVQGNLNSVRASGQNVVVAGADLYQLAASTFGSGEKWTSIARVNNIIDPLVTGVQTLLIPPTEDGADGVLTV